MTKQKAEVGNDYKHRLDRAPAKCFGRCADNLNVRKEWFMTSTPVAKIPDQEMFSVYLRI